MLILGVVAANPASIAELERALDAHPSATVALTEWCASHGIAGDSPARIRAKVLAGSRPLPRDGSKLLGIAPNEPVKFRHVRLTCNGTVLSEAFNWYVPSRLSAEMNAQLASSDIPFGTVAAPLNYHRIALDSRRARASGCPGGTVLTRRALLRLPDESGLALLVECYTHATLQAKAIN